MECLKKKKRKTLISPHPTPHGKEKLGSSGTHAADAVEISTGNLSRLPDSNMLLQMLFIPGSQKRTKKINIYFTNRATMQHTSLVKQNSNYFKSYMR